MRDEKTIIHLKFQSTLHESELYKIAEKRKEEFKKVRGLLSFIYHYNEETKTIGGTYIFENIIFARAFIGRFMIEGVGPRYGIIPMSLKIDIAQIKEELEFNFIHSN
ncbi:hypothetical protein U6A24_10700 [Aquimarina gracilis]|uniref:Uncharacterized protein n=1 Tax=Aquimarina gracilis TaxID=874422 RepID=A0ABU5ZVP5_9FLAO|nr:hypothetical protein [Aquimarina gracilis]MEB3345932.1 hypothetical protein [Aquimarina gracilis]